MKVRKQPSSQINQNSDLSVETAEPTHHDSSSAGSLGVQDSADQPDHQPLHSAQKKQDKKAVDTAKLSKEDVKKKKKKQPHWVIWPIKAFLLSFALSVLFSIISELVVTSVSQVIFSVALLLGLIFVNIFFDVIAMAFAVCDIKPFYSMASKKTKGAKQSLALLKSANVVSSVCGDIIGDICGIVSGAAGAGIVLKLALTDTGVSLWVSILVSATIAAVTISGKAFSKHYAMTNAQKIVERVGRFVAFFTFG